MTFGQLADDIVPELSKGFRNAKHAAQWLSTINTYADSLRGKLPADITTDDVVSVLRPIWTTKSETASRLRGRIERILDAAKAKGLQEGENRARWRGQIFYTLKEAKIVIESWRQHYNTIRPHSSLGYVPPVPEVAPWPAAQPRPAPPATQTVALKPTMH